MQNGRQFFVPEARLVLGFALHFTCQNRFHERHQNARKGRWFRVCCEVVGGLGLGRRGRRSQISSQENRRFLHSALG